MSNRVGAKFPSGYIHSVDQSAQRIHPFGIGPERIVSFGIFLYLNSKVRIFSQITFKSSNSKAV